LKKQQEDLIKKKQELEKRDIEREELMVKQHEEL